MKGPEEFDIGALVAARKEIHSTLKRLPLHLSPDHKLDRAVRCVASYSSTPEKWEAFVGVVGYAKHKGISTSKLVVDLELSNASKSRTSAMEAFLEHYDRLPMFERSRLLTGAEHLAEEMMEEWDIGTVVVTTINVCKRLCKRSPDSDCMKKCFNGQLARSWSHGAD